MVLATAILMLLQFVNLLAAFADDGAGTGCVDGHCDELEGPLDDDLGEVDLGDTGIEVLTYLGVFEQLGCIVIPAVPIGVPAADDSYSVVAGSLFTSALAGFTPTMMVTWLERLRIRPARP